MTPKYIILHHSLTKDGETVSWQAIRNYHINKLGWKDIGYHFGIELINNEYEIIVGRMLNETGAHCKEQGMNHKSLGICFIGNFDKKEPTVVQWYLGIQLVRSLCDVFNIPRKNVKGHRELATYKSCPGNMFDLEQFRKEL